MKKMLFEGAVSSVVAIATALAATGTCTPNPTPPPSQPLSASQVASELIEAGCLAAGPNDVQAVASELQTGHDPWLACMFDGGSVQTCNAPCERAGFVRRPADQ